MKKADILKAAKATFEGEIAGVFYDVRRRFWIVEYVSDPAIVYRAIQASNGSIKFDRIDD